MTDDDILNSPDVLHNRIAQLEINCDWLIRQFFVLHDILGLPVAGTWQDTVRQVVEHIKRTNHIGDKGKP